MAMYKPILMLVVASRPQMFDVRLYIPGKLRHSPFSLRITCQSLVLHLVFSSLLNAICNGSLFLLLRSQNILIVVKTEQQRIELSIKEILNTL